MNQRVLRTAVGGSIFLIASVVEANGPAVPGKEHTNSLGMRLLRIEPGKFQMGAGESPPKTREEWLQRDEDEAPAHSVQISRPFHIGIHEVTNAQYEQFDPEHRKLRGKHGATTADEEPVTFITWQQATAFCQWLSKKERKPYRLPTEAEWEYACRAATTSSYSTGERITPAQANLGKTAEDKPLAKAMKVGSYAPNGWGLFDMHGNVAEWCADWYGPYEAGTQVDPVGRADGHARVVRGWSFQQAGNQGTARFARSANRSGLLPEDANRYTGFRVVLGEAPDTKPLAGAELPLHQRNVKQTAAPTKKRELPFFVNYADGKKNPVIPPNTWGPIFSNHNHYSAVCVCPNGDVLAAWYTCVGESDRQLAQAASRLRAGSDTWEPASLFFGVPDINCHAPVLLRDGERIYHFCTQSLHGWDYASNIMRYSDDSGATWSKPQIILPRTDPDALSQPCSAFVAADGTLVLACDGDRHQDERLMLSPDRGKTWRVAKGDMRKAVGKYAIHPAIVPRKDGAILSFLRGPDPMPLLISTDRGDSWQVTDSPFGGIGVGQKACALRLASGAIALLTFDRHKQLGGGAMIALSLDEGKTWPHARKVEAPVSGYMSLDQADDGTIYLIGSRMNFAACNEAWIRQGKAWLGPRGATEAGATSDVGKLAASMKPGEWRELKSAGYDFTELMRGEDILAYSGKAAWDAVSQQALFIGQVHLKGPPVFITYAAKTNSWRRMATPKWAEPLKWFHAYENNTADSARGVFYHHSSNSSLVHRYDVAKDEWTTLPDLKAPTNHGTALEYFPERKGLVRVLNGSVWFWSEEKNTWTRLAEKLEMGGLHNFACYCPKVKVVVFGGGNNSRALYRLDADGKITAATPAPVELGIGRSLNVSDPLSGELLVLSKDARFRAYHPEKDSWRELLAEGMPFQNYKGHSVSAVPMSNLGVVLYFSSRPQGMKTYLYKHAEG